MIHVTRFDGSDMVVNANLIEHIESNPDTVITLVNRRKLVVREPMAEILERIIAYQRDIGLPATGKIVPLTLPAIDGLEVVQ